MLQRLVEYDEYTHKVLSAVSAAMASDQRKALKAAASFTPQDAPAGTLDVQGGFGV